MNIELDPPRGITGFPFGMPAAELKVAAAALGEIRVRDEGSAEMFRSMRVMAVHPQFEIVFALEDGKTLTAAEVWIPRPGPEEISVTFRGINVFTIPARELLRQIESMGYEINSREPNGPVVPHLCLGLTREAGHEVPLDTDGEPLYFQAVLAAPESYYDLLADLPRYQLGRELLIGYSGVPPQAQLIQQGKFDEAMKMDIDEIRQIYGTKCDAAIKQMIDDMPGDKGLQAFLSSNGWKIRYCLLQ